MARAIWNGSLTFGLVNLPIGVFSATEDRGVHFHQFERGTSDRVRYQRINERTGKKVEYADIVKGAEVDGTDGAYVVVDDDELEQIAPNRSRALEITGFVDLDQIDPIYFEKTYYLAANGESYRRTYALLLAALRGSNRAGIASLVLRGKEHLAVVRALGDVMALQTLFFADEIRDTDTVLGPSQAKADFDDKELTIAKQFIEALGVEWNPEDYHDTYRERVEKLLQSKRKGGSVITEEDAPAPSTNVIDLMDALKRSVKAAGNKHGASGASRSTRGERSRKKAS
jgi:DNA end-binding protein Ku